MAEVDRVSEYVIDEAPEISVSERGFLASQIYKLFPALEVHNYRIYFYAGLVSLIGTWLQAVAEGWLILQLTNSPFWVGVVSAANSLPTLFFALFGGAIVDRLAKKNIILFTQSASMILALIYGILTVTHHINVAGIIILAALLGIVTALDMPARQAFIPKLVGPALIGSAVALGAGTFNAARVLGPSVAGLLIAWIGSGGAFLLNGISYIAVIIALWKMKIHEEIPKEHPDTLTAIKEGLSYSFKHPTIRVLLFLTAISSIFGWSYSTMMPVIAKQIFHFDATGLGYLYAVGGVGALLGTVIVSGFSKRTNLRTVFILGGSIIYSLGIILFSFNTNIPLAFVLLFFISFGLLIQFTTLNATLQHLAEDSVRGRVMSIYVLMFIGLSPFGSFEVGILSEHLGTFPAIRIGAIVVFVSSIVVLFSMNRIRSSITK